MFQKKLVFVGRRKNMKFCIKVIIYHSIRHGLHIKYCRQQFLVFTYLHICCLASAERYTSLIRINVVCVIVTEITILQSRCLATTGGITYRHTGCLEGCMTYSVEMGTGIILYKPLFIKIDSGI